MFWVLRMGREYTKCDTDGVPRLVQKIKYCSITGYHHAVLFDGTKCYFDVNRLVGLDEDLLERLGIGDAEIYEFLENHIKENMQDFIYVKEYFETVGGGTRIV